MARWAIRSSAPDRLAGAQLNSLVKPSPIARGPHDQMTRFERVFVWLGGVAFVGSVALSAYTFGFRWPSIASSRAVPSWQAAIANAALFTVFAGHHSLFARDGVKAWMAGIV